ncbi:MAG: mandelate racemase/muconate lactonizing enzyme family protein [Actinomycetia bacterium]|nr:mandelate racemase/muconate lactonizing enzyme family protein [Actinomycetes bacterium]
MSDSEGAAAAEATADWPETDPFTIESVSVEVYRAAMARPVRTAFGAMADRPAVVVGVRSSEGGIGSGEVWCNFPAPAAEYRARLIRTVVAPLMVGRRWPHPRVVFDHLSSRTEILAIQSGERGPFSAVIAGIDIALWDMAARQAGKPLWRLLGGGRGDGSVPTYASGIGPDEALEQARNARAEGHRAFKLKVGFGEQIDLDNLAGMRRLLGPDAPVAVDANQAWSPDEAERWASMLAPYHPMWLEEPIAASHCDDTWIKLARTSPIPLAGGENLCGESEFHGAMGHGSWAVIQPDVTKWGGISGCLPLARRIIGAGKRFCPHYLGGGIGLIASAHLLAAVGGDGLLEVDSNPNPLREGLAQPFPPLADGRFQLSEDPGLGVCPDQALAPLRTAGETLDVSGGRAGRN